MYASRPDISVRSRIEKVLRKFSLLTIFLLSPMLLLSQTIPAAKGGNARFLIGAEGSYFNTDFPANTHMIGITAFADLHFNARYGIEGQARFINFKDFHGENERTYLGGPKIYIKPNGSWKPFAKLLLGIGSIQYPFNIGSGTYFAYAPGGGLDYRASRNWYFRAEYEYQFWPSAPGIPNEPNHGLTPNGVSGGIAYRIF
jgi:opacity protein-like surface antigen